MTPKTCYVCMLSSRSRNLYIGVTSDLYLRVHQHKTKQLGGHTAKYNIDRLVYFEEFPTPGQAIAREKELKLFVRGRKIELIDGCNPTWEDLSDGWYEETSPQVEELKTK